MPAVGRRLVRVIHSAVEAGASARGTHEQNGMGFDSTMALASDTQGCELLQFLLPETGLTGKLARSFRNSNYNPWRRVRSGHRALGIWKYRAGGNLLSLYLPASWVASFLRNLLELVCQSTRWCRSVGSNGQVTGPTVVPSRPCNGNSNNAGRAGKEGNTKHGRPTTLPLNHSLMKWRLENVTGLTGSAAWQAWIERGMVPVRPADHCCGGGFSADHLTCGAKYQRKLF